MAMKLMKKLMIPLALLLGGFAAAPAANYNLDTMHTAVVFKISHLGLSWTYGRFKDVAGEFSADPAEPSKASFKLTIKSDSIDTDNAKRDGHLRSPDFLNTKQFPLMSFQSTAAKAIDNGYEVTGDFTMHGVTKPITFKLLGGRVSEFPKGVQRTGFSTELAIRRSDYGMDRLAEAIGDDVYISISFEGTKK
jgi:polyisoprenoid-binding protein YceI